VLVNEHAGDEFSSGLASLTRETGPRDGGAKINIAHFAQANVGPNNPLNQKNIQILENY